LTLAELKILLVRMNMSMTDLAKKIDCARPSIYLAFSKNNRPGVLKRVHKFYSENHELFQQ